MDITNAIHEKDDIDKRSFLSAGAAKKSNYRMTILLKCYDCHSHLWILIELIFVQNQDN